MAQSGTVALLFPDLVNPTTPLQQAGDAESFDFMAGWIKRAEQSDAIHASQ